MYFLHFNSYNKILLVLFLVLSSNVYADDDDPDPWEAWNRAVFAMNDQVDHMMLKPMAKAYDAMLPDLLEHRVNNVFSNINEVTVIANQLLQFKFKHAASDVGRFLINTTFGGVGMFDVASKMGLEKHDEDFGQTLGAWGFDAGPYFVIPFRGPSTLRDAAGFFPDGYLDALVYIDHVPSRNLAMGTDIIITRSELLDKEKLVTGDRYIFIRDAYLQRRAYLVADGAIEEDDEDFDDYE